jgi:hypothetical protein
MKQHKPPRVLLGFDFPYGYPTGLAAALGLHHLQTAPWKTIWNLLQQLIVDNKNANNRFQMGSYLNEQVSGQSGPFWGCPRNHANCYLAVTSPSFPFTSQNGVYLNRLRITEGRIRGVQETWKLYGAGSAGSQALTGIPYVHWLRNDPLLNHFSQVWPFETGFTSTPAPSHGPFVLHAEIWPGIVKDRVTCIREAYRTSIPDQVQVISMCEWAANQDLNGTLAQLFDSPRGLSQMQVQACMAEEGWILGV